MMPGCAMSSTAPPAGSSWPGAASFVGMWILMMVPMMLPALVPMLRRYRSVVPEEGRARLALLTAWVGAGYFLVWAVAGLALYPLTIVLRTVAAGRPAIAGIVPWAAGTVVLIAGILQLTAWKARRLAGCREAPVRLRADSSTAVRHGSHLGGRCGQCCGNLRAILIALGAMDLRVMTVVTAAITAERLAPAGERVAQAVGLGAVVLALAWMARSVGAGL